MPDIPVRGERHLPANRQLQVIPDTKVIPPRGARYLMPRVALMTRLMDARKQRCVVIQGPAGSGKTSTLLTWRRELMALNYDVAWLSVTSDDDDPMRLSHCLLAALSEVDGDMTREAALLLGRDLDEHALEHWIILLVQGIAQRDRELLLVLDDVHHLNDPGIVKALGWLLDYAPANLHLVLGSRTALPAALPLGRLRSLGQLSELSLQDLRFSAEESEHFLREQLGQITKRDAQTLHELTDGWAAGLQLYAIDLKSRRDMPNNFTELRDASTFAQFFEQEVLVRLEPADLELLTRTSICNRFCAALCTRLMNKPHALAWMMNQLTRLDANNLFITQVKSHDRETWYRLHPLLREVLRARVSALPQAEQQQLHAQARDWFFDQGHVDEAVRHALLAGEVEAAADIVEACAHDLMTRGSLSYLPNLLRKLPLEQIRERFGLQLVILQLHLFSFNFSEAQQIIDYLQANTHRLTRHQCDTLLVNRGALAMQLDDTEAVWQLLPALNGIPADANDAVLTGRASLLGWLYMYTGNYTDMRQLLAEGDRLGTSPRRTLIGRCIQSASLIVEGRISEADHVCRVVLTEAQAFGDSMITATLSATTLLATTLYEQNNISEACRLLEPRQDALERASLPGGVLLGLLTLANSHWLMGRKLEAQAYLDRLEEHAQRYGLDRLSAWSLLTRLNWAIQKNQSVQAEQLVTRLDDLAARQGGIDRGVPLIIKQLAIRAHIILHLYRLDYSKAADLLREVIPRVASNSRWPLVTTLRLQLAIAERGRGNEALAREQLLDALRMGHRLGLVRSVLDASQQMPAVLQQLLEQLPSDPVLSFYIQRLLAAAQPAPQATPSSAMATKPLSERESEVLQLMAQAMTNKKIARILNVSPETVKWHLRNLFIKLRVTGRDEAIAKWRDQIAKPNDSNG